MSDKATPLELAQRVKAAKKDDAEPDGHCQFHSQFDPQHETLADEVIRLQPVHYVALALEGEPHTDDWDNVTCAHCWRDRALRAEEETEVLARATGAHIQRVAPTEPEERDHANTQVSLARLDLAESCKDVALARHERDVLQAKVAGLEADHILWRDHLDAKFAALLNAGESGGSVERFECVRGALGNRWQGKDDAAEEFRSDAAHWRVGTVITIFEPTPAESEDDPD